MSSQPVPSSQPAPTVPASAPAPAVPAWQNPMLTAKVLDIPVPASVLAEEEKRAAKEKKREERREKKREERKARKEKAKEKREKRKAEKAAKKAAQVAAEAGGGIAPPGPGASGGDVPIEPPLQVIMSADQGTVTPIPSHQGMVVPEASAPSGGGRKTLTSASASRPEFVPASERSFVSADGSPYTFGHGMHVVDPRSSEQQQFWDPDFQQQPQYQHHQQQQQGDAASWEPAEESNIANSAKQQWSPQQVNVGDNRFYAPLTAGQAYKNIFSTGVDASNSSNTYNSNISSSNSNNNRHNNYNSNSNNNDSVPYFLPSYAGDFVPNGMDVANNANTPMQGLYFGNQQQLWNEPEGAGKGQQESRDKSGRAGAGARQSELSANAPIFSSDSLMGGIGERPGPPLSFIGRFFSSHLPAQFFFFSFFETRWLQRRAHAPPPLRFTLRGRAGWAGGLRRVLRLLGRRGGRTPVVGRRLWVPVRLVLRLVCLRGAQRAVKRRRRRRGPWLQPLLIVDDARR